MVTYLVSHPRHAELRYPSKVPLWTDSATPIPKDHFLPIPYGSGLDAAPVNYKNHRTEWKSVQSTAEKKPGSAVAHIGANLSEKRECTPHKALDHDNMRFINLIESPSYPLLSILTRSRYYHPVQEIGTGSFGKALLVKDLRRDAHEKQYVMKIIDTARLGMKERLDAVNEVQLLASLRHPYIISYKESFVERSFLCIVMDYADGGDLFKTITQQRRRGGRFSESQILRWFTQAALALKYLHEKHILHRDLKSQNLFLMSRGRLRLGDFGIAKTLDSTSAFTKTQIGTPYYLSPEICKNQPYSWASDIWSLGCILYELATLRVPFNAPNITTLLNKITSQPPPQIPDSYSSGLRQLCKDCLQREWKRRPSAAAILQREITQNEIRAMLFEEQRRRRRQALHTSGNDQKKCESRTTHDVKLDDVKMKQRTPAKHGNGRSNASQDKKKYQQFSIVGDLELPIPPRLTINSQREYAHAIWSQSTSAEDSPQTQKDSAEQPNILSVQNRIQRPAPTSPHLVPLPQSSPYPTGLGSVNERIGAHDSLPAVQSRHPSRNVELPCHKITHVRHADSNQEKAKPLDNTSTGKKIGKTGLSTLKQTKTLEIISFPRDCKSHYDENPTAITKETLSEEETRNPVKKPSKNTSTHANKLLQSSRLHPASSSVLRWECFQQKHLGHLKPILVDTFKDSSCR